MAQLFRKGLITEATRAVMAFGFEQMNLHKIQISHKAGNTASRRVIEKCGFDYGKIIQSM